MKKSIWIIPIIFATMWLGGCQSAPEQTGTAGVPDYVEVAPRVFSSAGDLVVYLPPQKTLLAGELVLDYTLPAFTDGDTAQWINRLQELLAAGINQILPAHGKALDLEALNWTRQYLVLLRSQICLLKSQGYADDDVYYFCRVPGYDKYTQGNDLFRENILFVLKEIREKGNECTLPSKALPKFGPVTITEAEKGDI